VARYTLRVGFSTPPTVSSGTRQERTADPPGARRAEATRLVRRPSWRRTNLGVLVVLVLALATGVGAQATGAPGGGWVVVAHGVVGLVVLALVPAKARVVAGGLRRRRPSRWASVGLAVLTLAALASGIASSTGLVASAGLEPLWVHVALALLLVPPLLWHVVARPVRPRRADVGRRSLLQAGLLAAVGAGVYSGLEGAGRLADLPGARRRFTGSHAVEPAAMPVTSWLDDAVPLVRGDDWAVTVTDAGGSRDLSLGELVASGTTTLRATLDCTSGWYATADWTGVPVARLIRAVGADHRSIRVRSLTGYDRFLPLSDLDRLLLAVGSGGSPLAPGHGYPARLVAPGRRGFWWVKWVVGVELSRRPWWAQSPFPLT
jgi:DMSO/TMAO reductase YedYZ molybdopterin-dependent catalytic subunit